MAKIIITLAAITALSGCQATKGVKGEDIATVDNDFVITTDFNPKYDEMYYKNEFNQFVYFKGSLFIDGRVKCYDKAMFGGYEVADMARIKRQYHDDVFPYSISVEGNGTLDIKYDNMTNHMYLKGKYCKYNEDEITKAAIASFDKFAGERYENHQALIAEQDKQGAYYKKNEAAITADKYASHMARWDACEKINLITASQVKAAKLYAVKHLEKTYGSKFDNNKFESLLSDYRLDAVTTLPTLASRQQLNICTKYERAHVLGAIEYGKAGKPVVIKSYAY